MNTKIENNSNISGMESKTTPTKRKKVKTRDLNFCLFYLSPNGMYLPTLNMVFGSEKVFAPLIYDFNNNNFKLNVNPYGEKRGIEVKNIEINDEFTELYIETDRKSFLFNTVYDTDKIFIKLLKDIIENNFHQKKWNLDDTQIEIVVENGMFLKFSTIVYDKNHTIIPLKGLKIRIQEYDSKGKPDDFENLLRKLPIVSSKFIYYYYESIEDEITHKIKYSDRKAAEIKNMQ